MTKKDLQSRLDDISSSLDFLLDSRVSNLVEDIRDIQGKADSLLNEIEDEGVDSEIEASEA